MNEHHSDPFVVGLVRFFNENPKIKPATIGVKAGLSQWAIGKILSGATKSPKRQNADRIAEALGLTVERIIAQDFEGTGAATALMLAVAGEVGAGARVELIDAYAKGDGKFHIECPPQISPRGHVAVEVVGDSMAPYYEEGGVLIYCRATHDGVPTEAIGRICVCEDSDGRAWLKQVKPGTEPGLFHLLSINPTGDNLHNRALRWAAPVRMYLPSDMVKRISAM